MSDDTASESDWSVADLPWDRLHAYRRHLKAEELRTSFWRRVLQARLNMLDAGACPPVNVHDLAQILADAFVPARRLAYMRLTARQAIPEIGEGDETWHVPFTTPTSDSERAQLREALVAAETRLSEYRAGLHRRIDETTQEVITRYQQDPALIDVIVLTEAMTLARPEDADEDF